MVTFRNEEWKNTGISHYKPIFLLAYNSLQRMHSSFGAISLQGSEEAFKIIVQ